MFSSAKSKIHKRAFQPENYDPALNSSNKRQKVTTSRLGEKTTKTRGGPKTTKKRLPPAKKCPAKKRLPPAKKCSSKKRIGEIFQGRKVVNFYSGGVRPFCKLSNFFAARVTSGLDVYPTSEHLYQSLKCMPNDRVHFQVGGKFSSFESGQSLIWPDSKHTPNAGDIKASSKKKGDSWKPKEMLGVMAKMAVAPARTKKLRIQRLPKAEWLPMATYERARSVWIPILQSKFQNVDLAALLISTGDAYLLEFDRRAKSNQEKSRSVSRWGGMVRDSVLFGENWMGRLIMEVRSVLKKKFARC